MILSVMMERNFHETERIGRGTGTPAAKVRAPLIAECPINIECVVQKRVELGTHDWIIGRPVATHTASELADGSKKLYWEPAVCFR